MIAVCLCFFAFCLGVVLGEIDAHRKRKGWKEYRPSTNPLRDFKP